nr:uncharacterized protein LOC126542598 [Dermacentor andersoni]
MVGFRPHLSTQDVMLQLYHEIINDPTSGNRAILGLDLEKAFHNVADAAILSRINKLNMGERIYNYIRDFLSRRTVTLAVGSIFDEHALASAGTPQGSVISTLPFNLVMLGLPAYLDEIDSLHQALYADDITLSVGRQGQSRSDKRHLTSSGLCSRSLPQSHGSPTIVTQIGAALLRPAPLPQAYRGIPPM